LTDGRASGSSAAFRTAALIAATSKREGIRQRLAAHARSLMDSDQLRSPREVLSTDLIFQRDPGARITMARSQLSRSDINPAIAN
jgi:hypothetical protein